MKLKKYKSVICIIAAVCLLGAAVFVLGKPRDSRVVL